MKTKNKKVRNLTINIWEASEGGYIYDIYINKELEELEDIDGEDGGHCTGTLRNALDMTNDQAKDMVKILEKKSYV